MQNAGGGVVACTAGCFVRELCGAATTDFGGMSFLV